ncbi:MAG: lipocalin-like domain-containing protein [Muribaculaceae bacterium]|nr:lipocalin-like domain-containing protein [Muribaculaceae bacterium]
MKNFRKIFFGIITFTICSCTQNGGHIGRLFGSWYLYEMTVDNVPQDFDGEDCFWGFQANIIQITCTDNFHNATRYVGSWSEAENILTLSFDYSDDHNKYTTPAFLLFPDEHEFHLEYIEKGKKTMTLQRIDNEGKKYIYHLKHTY